MMPLPCIRPLSLPTVVLPLVMMVMMMMMAMVPVAVSSSLVRPEQYTKLTTMDGNSTTSTTRVGNNLCRVCVNVYYKCTHNITGRCPDSFTGNGTVVWPPRRNSTKVPIPGPPSSPPPDYDDEWNRYQKDPEYDNYGQEDLKAHGRRKRSPPPRRPWGRPGRRWNDHPNNWRGPFPRHPMRNVSADSRPSRRCHYSLVKMCVSRTCSVQCCDGTPLQPGTDTCQQKEEDKLTCKNGGRLSTSGKYCYCNNDYHGKECELRKCSMKCQNGGVCRTNTSRTGRLEDTNHNDDYCICPEDTTGKFCETRACTIQCLNNATCLTDNYHSRCLCAEGFYGTRCEKQNKAGECPVSTSVTDCSLHWKYGGFADPCYRDDECPGDSKCCRNACGRRSCMAPHLPTSTCSYRNETYEQGTVFTPDPCRVCTCNGSHVGTPQGVVECTRLLCPELPEYCSHVITPPGACCPVCDDDPDMSMCAGNYTYPYFVNCPGDMVVIDVEKNSDHAPVNIPLQARDCKGDALDVYLADKYLLAGVGEENFQLTSATTARDMNGNFAECIFHVRVRDPYPPVFLTCPTDFTEPAPGQVTWEIPVARDNVGLAIPPTSRRHPGDKMAAGEYLIKYWAEDYQGNVATCSFVVTVATGYHTHLTPSPHVEGGGGKGAHHSHDHPHPLPHSHATISIAIGVTSTLLVLILIALALLFYRRQRSQRNDSGTSSGSVSGGSLAARWNSGGGGSGQCPPQYSLPPDDVMSPPMYSRSDELTGTACGGRPEAGELPSKSPFV